MSNSVEEVVTSCQIKLLKQFSPNKICEDEIKIRSTLTSLKNQTGKPSHIISSPLKILHDQSPAAPNSNGAGNPKLDQVMTMKVCEALNNYKKNPEKEELKLKNMNAIARKMITNTSDAFPFLRQTSSGRIVKRTQLASVNTKEFWVDRPARAKSTSPKHANEKMSIIKYLTKTNVIPIQNQSPKPDFESTASNLSAVNEKCDDTKSAARRNSTGSQPNVIKHELEVQQQSIKIESLIETVPIQVPDEELLDVKNDDKCSSLVENVIDFMPRDVEMISIEDTAQSSLLRVKLDHDYDIKKPTLPVSYNDNENEKEEIHEELVIKEEMIDDVIDKPEIVINISSNDETNKEILPSIDQDIKIENEYLIKREESCRTRKKKRLSLEVRTLIDESIKATKTLNFPTSRLRKPRAKLRNKQRRTECEMLLDMLTENPGPDNLIRIKNRNLPSKQVIVNAQQLKTTPKSNKIHKLSSPKVKEELKSDGIESIDVTPNKHRDKKLHTPLVAQKKNKAIKMKLKLEKKKKICLAKEVNNFQSSNVTKPCDIGTCNQSKSYKSIVLQDLKEKVKAKMEKTDKRSPESKCGEMVTYCPQKRAPGRPRIHHSPQLPKPAKVSRHGRTLGRPPKMTTECSKLPFVIPSNMTPAQSSCFLKVPYVALCPTPLEKKLLLQKKVILGPRSCDVVLKDYCRQRSSQRQAESSCKYKEIALKSHEDFTQIILTSQNSTKSGLNPQVFKELKKALLLTAKDNKCKLLLLNGIGSIFCSGVDLSYIVKDNKDQRQKAVEDMVTTMKEFLRILITYPKPIVVAVNGLARGLGVGMLLLCDIIYASDKAVFEMPYSQLGQFPEGCVSVTLPRNLSSSMVNDLLFTGRKLTATEAHQSGLVSQVFWPNDLLEQVLPRVQKMASQIGHVMETTKALLRQKIKSELEASLENECQLLMNQWCQAECQRCIKDFLEQTLP